ncbi:hypothetical protein [Mammaliicoccus sp. JADD-157]|uniref:hypothetical protein n=1 Tax=Mammaliicoccus sp. JADD-157 TaxID=3404818 RepID=UPI003BB751DB
MGYEHERWIKHLIELRLITEGYNPNGETKAVEELREVYAKAKAWDNYLADVDSSVREISNNEDEVKWHVDYAINEYMEDGQ